MWWGWCCLCSCLQHLAVVTYSLFSPSAPACHQTNCGIGALAEFDLDVLINNPLLASTNMEEVKKLKACDNKGIRPVRVQGIKRAWNAPGLRYKVRVRLGLLWVCVCVWGGG